MTVSEAARLLDLPHRTVGKLADASVLDETIPADGALHAVGGSHHRWITRVSIERLAAERQRVGASRARPRRGLVTVGEAASLLHQTSNQIRDHVRRQRLERAQVAGDRRVWVTENSVRKLLAGT